MTKCDCELGHNGLGMANRECDCLERKLEKPFLDGTTAMLLAITLQRAGDCRRASIEWVWHGKWTAQDWKNSGRSEVALARRLRLSGTA